MAATWRVFGTKIALQPEKVEKIVLATCALHNFLRVNRPLGFTVDTDFELGNWRNYASHGMANLEGVPRRAPTDAKEVRELYCDYVNNEGAVPWQESMI